MGLSQGAAALTNKPDMGLVELLQHEDRQPGRNELRASLQAHDEEWEAKVNSIKDMLHMVKGYLHYQGDASHNNRSLETNPDKALQVASL